MGAGNKNLVIAVSITAYSGSKTGKGRIITYSEKLIQCRPLYMHNVKSIQGRQFYIHNIKLIQDRQFTESCTAHKISITLFAAMADVPITLPWSSTTSMPSLSSWCRINTELRVLAVAACNNQQKSRNFCNTTIIIIQAGPHSLTPRPMFFNIAYNKDVTGTQ